MNPLPPEDQDRAWALLKRARAVAVDPFFSRNVVRVARQTASPAPAREFWRRLLAPRVRLLWAAVIVISGLAWWQLQPPPIQTADSQRPPLPAEAGAQDTLASEMASELALLDEVDGLLEVTEAGELNEDDVGLLLF